MRIAGATSAPRASRHGPRPPSASTANRSSLPRRVPIGSWRHLIAQFFRVGFAVTLSPAEKAWVQSYLVAEKEPFFAQSRSDQRHGYESARRVGELREVVRAALLHDIGKRHAGLGLIGRVLVSAAAKFSLPVGRRGSLYLDHGGLAAAELTALGAEPLVVEFARDHHGERPATISPEDWTMLIRADR